MYKSFKSMFGAAGLLVLASLSAEGAHAEWRGWNVHPATHPVGMAMDRFGETVAKVTEGRLLPKTYHEGVLLKGGDIVPSLKSGEVDFAVLGGGALTKSSELASAFGVPFLFDNGAQMFKVVDGPIGDKIEADLAAQNLVAVGWYDSGARSFYNAVRPITKPEDLADLRLRTITSEPFASVMAALKVRMTPMTHSDIKPALENGLIDGAENNVPTLDTSEHYKLVKYYSLTRHVMIPECLCINKALWDSLSPADQALVRTAGEESALYQRELWAAREKSSYDVVVAGGVTVNDVDVAAFRAAIAPVTEAYLDAHPSIAAIVTDIEAAR